MGVDEMMNGGTATFALAVGALLAGIVALFAHAVRYDRDRYFYPVVLTVVAALYPLFAVTGGGRGLFAEVLFFFVFATLAAAGFRWSLWMVAAGLFLHGAFDFVRHEYLPAPGAPEWWPAFCGAYDVVAAFGLGLILLLRRKPVEQSGGP